MRRSGVGGAADLAAAPLTYREVGATRDDVLPAGYGRLQRDVGLGTGPAAFERAVAGLFAWRMHERAGLAVERSGGPAAEGTVVVLRAGWGPARLTIPCRVVYVVDEVDRRGFAYGTLPGHPERGEEAFVVSMGDGGEVRARIRAFSAPATLAARTAGPIGRAVQRYVTDRYVNALRELALGPSRR